MLETDKEAPQQAETVPSNFTQVAPFRDWFEAVVESTRNIFCQAEQWKCLSPKKRESGAPMGNEEANNTSSLSCLA